MARKMSDCRRHDKGITQCTLVMIGTESELLHSAIEHAVSVHGETAGPELAEELRKSFTDAPPGL
jgi:hypothetical protein